MSNRFDRIEGTIAAPAPTSVTWKSTPRMMPSAAARSASIPTSVPSSPWKLIGGVRSVATFTTPADLMSAGSLSARPWVSATPGSLAISAAVSAACAEAASESAATPANPIRAMCWTLFM